MCTKPHVGGTSVETVPFGGVDTPFLCRFSITLLRFFSPSSVLLFRCDRDSCCELLSCVCVVRQNVGVRKIEEWRSTITLVSCTISVVYVPSRLLSLVLVVAIKCSRWQFTISDWRLTSLSVIFKHYGVHSRTVRSAGAFPPVQRRRPVQN